MHQREFDIHLATALYLAICTLEESVLNEIALVVLTDKPGIIDGVFPFKTMKYSSVGFFLFCF